MSAKFIEFNFIDETSQMKSNAVVQVCNDLHIVPFWHELIDQWGMEDLKEYLCAEALFYANFKEDAIELLKPKANGELVIENDELKSDTRNWRQNLIDFFSK